MGNGHKQSPIQHQLFNMSTLFLEKITLCPPVVCPKNTLPTCGLKIGTLSA